jgi:hypothetical protein
MPCPSCGSTRIACTPGPPGRCTCVDCGFSWGQVACPKCGSINTQMPKIGYWECLDCGYTWGGIPWQPLLILGGIFLLLFFGRR